MGKVTEIADGFIDVVTKHGPIGATYLGVPGYDDILDDFSPDAAKAAIDDFSVSIRAMKSAEPENDRERMCKETFLDEAELSVNQFEARDHLRDINVLFSPIQNVRQVFDLMPQDTSEAWENIASRLEAIPGSLSGYREALNVGRTEGLVSSVRQTSGCATQCETWSGQGGNQPFF